MAVLHRITRRQLTLCLRVFLSQNPQVLQQDLQPNCDQDNASGDLRPLLVAASKHHAHPNADGGDGKGGDADQQYRKNDVYLEKGKAYFGELTFTPSGGFDRGRLPETDLLFGQKTILSPPSTR